MALHGKQIIGSGESSNGPDTFRGVNPATGAELNVDFFEATDQEVDRAVRLADEDFDACRAAGPDRRADFLEQIAEQIEALGDELIERAGAETGLPEGRLTMERGRTMGQLRLFAGVVREGSWVEARIDSAIPDRQPLAKPDLRRMLIPLGPVAVFGASNFPMAFSVAGGDTASALAAGCPVVVKAHPAHPGTSELVGESIQTAARDTGLPAGVFSMLQSTRPELSIELVRHPLLCAVGFTGSLRAGRALFDAASSRPRPIPVFAEMGSVNPVFVLPGAEAQNPDKISEGLAQSVTLGVGQFCTNPGLVVGLDGEPINRLIDATSNLLAQTPAGTMLHAGIGQAFTSGVQQFESIPGVEVAERANIPTDAQPTSAAAVLFHASADTFLANESLSEELFGPSTLVIRCGGESQLLDVAKRMDGQLTATILGTEADLAQFKGIVRILERKVGRLIFNQFPTGVEVCASMQHGGPYPATTDARTTSVGTAAIGRFARPICYQNFPLATLPAELGDANERNIWRLVDNGFMRDLVKV